MTPDEYYLALANAGEGITATEGTLRKLASRSPNPVEREEALAAADTLSATRRRLRARAAARQPYAVREESRPLGKTKVGGLEIDRRQLQATLDGRVLPLSRKEYELLCALAGEPTRTFTKSELLRDVWGYRSEGRTRTIDAHACRLRRKLGPGWVQNVWGIGYRLLPADLRPNAPAGACSCGASGPGDLSAAAAPQARLRAA